MSDLTETDDLPWDWTYTGTDLHLAIFHKNLPEIDKQIENGASIDLLTGITNGDLPLNIALYGGNSYCIKAVLKHNPFLNYRYDCEDDFDLPLHIVVKSKSIKSSILKLMLEMGADPNLPGSDKNRPLHLIATTYESQRTKASEFAEILIKFGASVNAKNSSGDTPLHLAIKSGFDLLVGILLRNGANMTIRNHDGITPIGLVRHLKTSRTRVFFKFGLYIVKQTTIKKQLYLHQDIVNEFYQYSYLKLFKSRCDQELSEFKSKVIDKTSVTYYDLLVSPPDVVTKYVRNETLIYGLLSDRKKYIYGHEINKILRYSLLRNKAIYIGYKFFEEFSPVILPDLCLDAICNHLTNEDLLMLKNFTC